MSVDMLLSTPQLKPDLAAGVVLAGSLNSDLSHRNQSKFKQCSGDFIFALP
jgi:hypothetical protein